MADGVLLLEILEAIKPDTVEWKKVKKSTTSMFHHLANLTYFLECLRTVTGSDSGMDAQNLRDGGMGPILAVLWRMRRYSLLNRVAKKTNEQDEEEESDNENSDSDNPEPESEEDDSPLTEDDVLQWANSHAQPSEPLVSFSDPTLASGVYLANLLATIRPDAVDFSLLDNEDPSVANVRLVLTSAWGAGLPHFYSASQFLKLNPRTTLALFANWMQQA
eukprot:TRINITY_DN26623_c0_g1_i1.p1 TRINITY_DN26623_c0_g1~~TRINITY_DN26623_c0_g1_i1.p1  ORF type:complete len:244 (-),score=31.16 TRINITY_DN26623_c0_g1_i1:44-700(-)